ncbi:MAG TPA: GDSL-type esterase/lipase family protein [Bacteroidia bacterium]|nr:GDSL-type esterase/lipase family protein [Bacteroidia bacterium]
MAQVPDIDSMVNRYPFIRPDLSIFHNDSSSLSSFYKKLEDLKAGKRDRVNVVHIGDSHLQADFFSGTVRQLLQIEFGNAGRGFVFPYRVARSNEPASYKTSSNVKWESKRNVFPDQSLPIGIGGFTIETKDTNATLSLLVKDQGALDYSFNKFTLFHDKGRGSFGYAVCDDFNCKIGQIDSKKATQNPYVSIQEFNTPMHQMMISCNEGDSCGYSRIYGMLLENGKPGILYSMIGVNGAEYKHYNLSVHFQEQLSYLEPDLIIISLGTNEGFSGAFDKSEFIRNMDTLVSGVRSRNPKAEILLTTPGDSFKKSKKGRVKNPNMTQVRNAIVDYAEGHGCAWWDLYEIMGGYGSMAKWYAAHISSKDRVHFSGQGYVMQGGLFYKALMKGYTRYKK